MELQTLGAEDLTAIARLLGVAVLDPPTERELHDALFGTAETVVVRGVLPDAVVATVIDGDRGFVRCFAVDPAARRRGLGRALLASAEAEARGAGCASLTIGADAPGYLWPGVDTRELAAVACCEAAKFTRVETNFNMDVDLALIPADPGGWTVAGPAERAEVEAWAGRHWPWWRAELLRALEQDGLVLTRDTGGIAAVCAHGVTRAGLVGPVAVRPDLLGRGVGQPPLLGALHRMRAAGHHRAEISWVGPVVPYARIGATVGRTFFVYRKELS